MNCLFFHCSYWEDDCYGIANNFDFLTLKAPITTAADDNFFYIFSIFEKK